MFTDHQYLDRYPVQLDSKLLILGTIHPHNTGDFKIPFFSMAIKTASGIF